MWLYGIVPVGAEPEVAIMIKDIVVSLSVDRPSDVTADYAISLAEAFDAHLAAIAFVYEPVVPVVEFGPVPSAFLDDIRTENERAAKAAIERFENAAIRHEKISAASHVFDATLVGGSDRFASIARRFDISVVPQAEPDKSGAEELITEAALFGAGRPVIVVPYIQKGGLKLDRVLVCWDGSHAAARAVADAMPLLTRAGKVEVIIVSNEAPKSDELPGADLGEHLARHGITTEIKQIVAPGGDVASMILSYAADFSADFIVMGGYGHSRLKEFVLGGVTRGILDAMTVPVLMSH